MTQKLPCIKTIEVTAVSVPINPPHKTASGIVAASPLLLIDLVFDNGLVGHGLLFTYTPDVLKPIGDFLLNLQPLLQDHPLEPESLYELLQAKHRLLGTQGLVGMALAGIDMAMWDALSRHRHLPLYRLLGDNLKPVLAYGGTGFDGELGTALQAEAWAEKGYKGVKAKIGYNSIEQDVQVVNAMRRAVGNDVALMVDYNQSLSVEEAISRISVLDEHGLAWVEEPVLAHDYAGTAQVSAAVKTDIQSGENWWGPLDMQHALQADASNLVMPDVMKIGGVTGWMQALKMSEQACKRNSSHLWPELSAQLLSIGKYSYWLEYIDWWAPILETPLRVENGLCVLDENQIGSGVSWHASAIDRYRV